MSEKPPRPGEAIVMAGVPAVNNALYRRVRFSVGDPAALIEMARPGGGRSSVFIVRDIEAARARRHARADTVATPADYTPTGGLSGDRETATAQAVAELLRREGVKRVVADRTLPLLFADVIARAGMRVECDADLGVLDRRVKDAWELEQLRAAQEATLGIMRTICRWIGGAEAGRGGVLMRDGEALTSERVRRRIDIEALSLGFTTPQGSIVACGPVGADCHHAGEGPLRTGEPIIVDIFPRSSASRYWGDCTRTVVHGEATDLVRKMHVAVVKAKAAAIDAIRPSVCATGEQVHAAAIKCLREHGYEAARPTGDDPPAKPTMVHGTGHGVGLDVHEPPLLDFGGPALVAGDVVTIEPGLYCGSIGGVRVEDMVAVTPGGCEVFGSLPEGLCWG